VYHSIALCLARNAAIPYGQVLSNEEMERLINDLFQSTDVNRTPDGKTIIGILNQQELEHLMG